MSQPPQPHTTLPPILTVLTQAPPQPQMTPPRCQLGITDLFANAYTQKPAWPPAPAAMATPLRFPPVPPTPHSIPHMAPPVHHTPVTPLPRRASHASAHPAPLPLRSFAFISHLPATFPLQEPSIDNAQLARRKRRRTLPMELLVLMLEFAACKTPSRAKRQEIADRVSMSEKAVQIWFQNRRQTLRKQRAEGKQDVVVHVVLPSMRPAPQLPLPPHTVRFRLAQAAQLPEPRRRQAVIGSQLAVLQREFDACSGPDPLRYGEIAGVVGMLERAVRVWFQNRRQQQRRGQLLEKTEYVVPTDYAEKDPKSDAAVPAPVAISEAQLSGLKALAEANRLPDAATLASIAQQLGLSEQTVVLWFQQHQAQHPPVSPRTRRVFSQHELEVLTAEFAVCAAPTKERRDEISAQINVPDKAVLLWFQNRRRLARREGTPMVLPADHYSSSDDSDLEQKGILTEAFEKNRSPGDAEIEALASTTGMLTAQVRRWFVERRRAWRLRHPLPTQVYTVGSDEAASGAPATPAARPVLAPTSRVNIGAPAAPAKPAVLAVPAVLAAPAALEVSR